MIKFSFRQILCSTALIVLLMGCAVDLQPHIYIPGEFNRSQSNFNKPLKDRDEVIICFNKLKATPQKISNLAVLECARFNKRAEFVKQETQYCPLVTPIAARYNCVADTKNQTTGRR